MSMAYTLRLREKIKAVWSRENTSDIYEGIYACYQGPSLETPSEYKFLNIIGADLVGMSTVPEVIVGVHAGMEIAVFSIVTNICYPPDIVTPTTLEEVLDIARSATPLINKVIAKIL